MERKTNDAVLVSRTRPTPALLAGCCLLALSPSQALAQDGAAANERGGLEEIIVTARKREESLQNIPASITALSTEQIRKNDITSLEKLAANQPQLIIGRSSSGSGAQIGMRGITSSAQSIGIEQSVAVVLDGVYYGQGAVINEGFMDLGRIEVLKGPQALFYGKNATAGVISITTADPGDQLEAMAKAGYEFNAKQVYGEAVISSPLGDTLGVRVALRGSKSFGTLFKNQAVSRRATVFDIGTGNLLNFVAPPASSRQPGIRELLGRVTLKWEPTDSLTATLKASGSQYRGNGVGSNFVVFSCPNGVQQSNPTARCGRKFRNYANSMPPELAATMPLARDGDLYRDYDAWAVTGTINYDVTDAIALTWINNYQYNRVKQLGDFQGEEPEGAAFWAAMDQKWHAFSSEARALTSFDGPLNILVGAYFQSTKRGYGETQALSGAPNSGIYDSTAALPALTLLKDSETKGKTYSGYGQIIFNPVETVELTGGVRYTHETKKSFFVAPYVISALQVAFIEGVPIFGDQVFNQWSPEFTARWSPNSNVTLYGGYKTGYKSGGFSNSSSYAISTVPENLIFNPETAKGFEFGVKTTWLDNTLRLNLNLYTFKYNNLQVDFVNSVQLSFITTNAGSARSKGMELEATWLPVEGLTLNGVYNYNKARYLEFLGPCYQGQTILEGCTLTGPGGALFQDLSGKGLLNAPRHSAAAGFSYETPVGTGLMFGVSGNARFSSSYSVSAFGQPEARQKSYTGLDAAVQIGTEDKRWELAVIGKNLTNKFIMAGSLDTPTTGSGTATAGGIHADQTGYVNNPRTVQVQVTFRM